MSCSDRRESYECQSSIFQRGCNGVVDKVLCRQPLCDLGVGVRIDSIISSA